MPRIKVLHVFKTYLPETIGGIEQVIRQLSLAGKALGIRSDILTLCDKPSHVTRLDGQIIYAAHRDLDIASTGISAAAIRMFNRIAPKYDIIHYHYPWPFGDLMALCNTQKKPCIVTYHSDIVKQRTLERLYRPLQQHFLKAMDRIVVTSPNYLASSKTLIPFKDKCEVIPIGADKASYPAAKAASLNKWRQLIKGDFFLFIGVLRYYKGLHTLLEAIKSTSLTVVIAGSGPMNQKLRQQAEQLQLSNVYFLGQISETDKFSLLELCTAVVLPSHLRSEAFGVTLLEGAMYGKPLISCEIGTGTTFINKKDVTGLTIPPSNAEALRNAMKAIINDPEQSKQLGSNALNHYQQHFTVSAMCKAYSRLYNDLIIPN